MNYKIQYTVTVLLRLNARGVFQISKFFIWGRRSFERVVYFENFEKGGTPGIVKPCFIIFDNDVAAGTFLGNVERVVFYPHVIRLFLFSVIFRLTSFSEKKDKIILTDSKNVIFIK